MRRDRSLFRSYVCQVAKHTGCRRRYPPTVGTIPRICGCQCHDRRELGETVDWLELPAPPAQPKRLVPLPDQRRESTVPKGA